MGVGSGVSVFGGERSVWKAAVVTIPVEQMTAGTESVRPADPPRDPVGGSVAATLASPPPPPPFHLSKLQGLLSTTWESDLQ